MGEVRNSENWLLVESSKLSVDDDFMKYYPETVSQRTFMEELIAVCKKGVPDFYVPKFDPTMDEFGEIQIASGRVLIQGKTYDWWEQFAKQCDPSRNSRLGTELQYIAFAGTLIKEMVGKGYLKSIAWYIACNNSESIGHYLDSFGGHLEMTGSRGFGLKFDLGNSFKLLNSDGSSLMSLASGDCRQLSDMCPVCSIHKWEPKHVRDLIVSGWIVRD